MGCGVGENRGTLAGMVKAFRLLCALLLLFVMSCAALGLGAPRTRVIPVGTKDDPEYGRCASSGYEVDLPPHATVAFVASTCIRPFDAGASASSGAPIVDAGGGGQ